MSNKKKILIIGAKSDIALAVAEKFASEGFSLQLAGRNMSNNKEILEGIKKRHDVNIELHEMDILKYDYFESFVESLSTIPDIVLCAVGSLGEQLIDQEDLELSSSIMKTNFMGPALIIGLLANYLEQRGHGTIIGISSVAGDKGRATNYIYGSAKAGLTTFLEGLRNRFGNTPINVITVIPGYVDTKMTKELSLPKIFTTDPGSLAQAIYKGYIKGSHTIYYLPVWKMIMLFINLIPNKIFQKLKL